ncbi:MarR family winged helix-turn-helix transcriptional regulator [Clostridium sp. 'White wine YQ']|uniref:MarR family winged helix-turn-helix transcriptional regulator n=1 Tax=Clostridium sp. 'White wine YQ' TaxID=3027474 RepID=UPI00236534DE|nr:MarR family transcriptional regulator [Clostridium sp. 'White wine YQ']MDD7795621.1 MarR family transcriptional regulator [Clostridium sp. 'White wine YQ']
MDIDKLINKASKLIRNKMNNELESIGLTYVQWSIVKDIYTIEEVDGDIEKLTPLEIGKRVGLDKATMSSVINRLIHNEWVEKIKNPMDKRSYYLLLTQKSRYHVDELEKVSREVNIRATKELSSQEKSLLESYLKIVIENLE